MKIQKGSLRMEFHVHGYFLYGRDQDFQDVEICELGALDHPYDPNLCSIDLAEAYEFKLIYHNYVNLDGVGVVVNWRDEQYIKEYVKEMFGYTYVVQLRGVLGCTELGLHTRTANKVGIVAFTRPNEPGTGAYVLLDDGKIIGGSFHLFPDNTFSLA